MISLTTRITAQWLGRPYPQLDSYCLSCWPLAPISTQFTKGDKFCCCSRTLAYKGPSSCTQTAGSMSWSDVVHENRKRAELQRAREELRLRRRGYAIEEKASAGIPAVLTLAGVLTATAWWRKEGRKVQGRDWKSLPGISHLLEFLNSGSQQKRAPTRSKAKPKAQLAPPSKAAAARQAAGKPAAAAAAAAGPARAVSGGGAASAAAAAGAAAVARAGGSSNAAPMQASTSSSGSSQQQSKAKKKKRNKKK